MAGVPGLLLPLAAGSGDKADSVLGSDLLAPLGGIAALAAMLGMLLILPLYITQRREVNRLLDWQERHPEDGDDGTPDPVSGAGYAVPRPGGRPMTAAERVTAERPALARIGTAEREAIELEQAPLWRRVVVRGPRHPLVISLLALVAAVGIFFAASMLLRATDDDNPSKGLDPASIQVVVVNASPFPGLASNVAEDVEKAKFAIAGTTASTGSIGESVVRYADGFKREAAAVARRLEIPKVKPFDAESEAAANGAPVVVVVGEDLAKGTSSLNQDGGGNGNG